jgi:hypothetical protein
LDAGLWPAGSLRPDDRARFATYDRWRAFFDGEQWTGRPLRGETRLTFNYARALTRKIASYVYSGPVRFSVLPNGADDAIANIAEVALGQVIRANGLDQLDLDLCIAASVLGDAAVKVTWDARHARPAVVTVDPSGLTVQTAGDDPRRIDHLAHGYWLAGEQLEPVLGAQIEGWQRGKRYRVIETWSDAAWSVTVDGSIVQDGPNPYGWIPYVIAVNNPRSDRFWGESDLIDLVDVCRELNSRMTVLSRVLELSGAPIAVLENVDGSEGIAVGPGAKWELPEGAKAYLLDLLQGGGVGLHVQYIDLLYRSLHDLSETPRTAFGDSGRALSGAALEVEIQPLVQKVRRKRQAWEAFHRERNRRILDLLERYGGQELGGLRETETIWPSVLPSDVDGSVRNAVALVQSGIQSRRTAYASLGGTDPEAEMSRVEEERRAGEEASRRAAET